MKNKQLIIGLAVGIIGVYAVSSLIVKEKLDGLRVHLDNKISLQQNIIRELASTIGVKTDEKISAFISECPANESMQYDRLLSALDKGLTKAELQGLNILFNRCGSIPASRRAATTMLLEREVHFFNELVYERSLLGGVESTDFNVSKWNALVERENEIISLFFNLVNLQKEIISTLAQGGDLKSVEPFQIEAGKVQSELTAVSESANEIRTVLVKS